LSGSGSTVDLLESVRVARGTGAKIIAITATGSPLAALADVLVRADVPEDLDVYAPMSSRLVHLALIDVLAVAVAVTIGTGRVEVRGVAEAMTAAARAAAVTWEASWVAARRAAAEAMTAAARAAAMTWEA
jgi:DNA-binding MurR/RpiR family transcriptional regulator